MTEPWMSKAACAAPDVDPNWYFSTDDDDKRKATAVCDRCAVVDSCRKYARRMKVGEGIWAGSERNRA